MKVFVEGEKLSGMVSPELVGVADGFFIELFVFIQVFKMRAGFDWVLVEKCLGNVEGVDLMGLRNLRSQLVENDWLDSWNSKRLLTTAGLGGAIGPSLIMGSRI